MELWKQYCCCSIIYICLLAQKMWLHVATREHLIIEQKYSYYDALVEDTGEEKSCKKYFIMHFNGNPYLCSFVCDNVGFLR